jgi:hypothetical protein
LGAKLSFSAHNGNRDQLPTKLGTPETPQTNGSLGLLNSASNPFSCNDEAAAAARLKRFFCAFYASSYARKSFFGLNIMLEDFFGANLSTMPDPTAFIDPICNSAET